MRAHARLSVTGSRIVRLRSEAPLVWRPTLAPVDGAGHLRAGPHAVHVALATAAAGPVGGDRLRLDVDVGAGDTLVVRGVSASLALPGPYGEPSRTDVHVRVAEHARLLWLPRPVIAARHCDHRSTTTISLATGARLVAREEVILGRHGEPPGTVRARLRVTAGGRPGHDQELVLGAGVPGWSGAAVAGRHRALGTVLVVDPRAAAGPAPTATVAALPLATTAFDDPSVLVSALAEDAVALRRRLEGTLAACHATAGRPVASG